MNHGELPLACVEATMNIPLFFGTRIPAQRRAALTAWLFCAAAITGSAAADAPANDFPTAARVQYVNECIEANGGTLAALYQCSCAIDRIAAHLSYDDFVEAGTYARYATLPGEGAGI